MKELTVEEKAQRYDEAISMAKKFHTPDSNNTNLKATLEMIFSELKESEDEKIRKEMLQIAKESEDSFYMVMTPNKRERLIAWLEKQNSNVDNANKEYWRGYREGKQEILDKYAELEKQGEQNPVISNDALREGIAHFGITQYQIDNWLKKYVDVEKQGEQKTADKAESNLLTVERAKEMSPFMRSGFENEYAAWSEEDERICNNIINDITNDKSICKYEIAKGICDAQINWLKSLKDRYTWKPSEKQMDALSNALSLAKNCGEESAFDLRTLYEQLKQL